MANTQARKSYNIVQGGGRVFIGPANTPVHRQFFADQDALDAAGDDATDTVSELVVGDITKSPLWDAGFGVANTRTAFSASDIWRDAGYLDEQGVSLSIGNEIEIITELESLWPIDARRVSSGAVFRAMLKESTLDNLFELGLSEVGYDFGTGGSDGTSADVKTLSDQAYVAADASANPPVAEVDGFQYVTDDTQKVDQFGAQRFGGPDEHIPGVGLVFDGPAPAANPTGATGTGYLRARRIFLPKVINFVPIDIVHSKRGQSMIRLDLTVLIPDHPAFRPCYIHDQAVSQS